MDDLQHVQVYKNDGQLQLKIQQLLQKLHDICAPSSKHSSQDLKIVLQSITFELDATIRQYEPQPQLLEKHLEQYITFLLKTFLDYELSRGYIGAIVYSFTKVCGVKAVILQFPPDVYLFDKLIEICQKLDLDAIEYACLLWLCNMVIVPFPLSSIDVSLSDKAFAIGKEHLHRYSNCSKVQVISLILLSRLLTRPDSKFLLQSYVETFKNTWPALNPDVKLGHLLVLNKILKRAQLKHSDMEVIYNCILNDLLLIEISSLNALYMIKILGKMGKRYIQSFEYGTVADIINTLVNEILLSERTITGFDTNLRYGMAKALCTLVSQLSFQAINYQSQVIEFIFDLITVHASNEEINFPVTHTALLTLGYIALLNKLPEKFVDQSLEIARRFLFYKVNRGTVVIGSQIRDSSCFLIWAIVRNLRQIPQQNGKSTVAKVFEDLLVVLIFDNELIVKKCGMAVIQEILGRLGPQIIPIENAIARGEYILKFVELLGNLHLNQKICYLFVDEYYNAIDMGFLIEPLVKHICEEDGDGKYLNKLLQQQQQQQQQFQQQQVRQLKLHQLPDKLFLRLNISRPPTPDVIKNMLIKSKKWHILYDVDDFREAATQLFTDFEFDNTNAELIKGYLNYIKDRQLENYLEWHNLLQATKNEQLLEEFRAIIANQDSVPLDEIVNHLPHNTVLSKTIFDFKHFSQDQLIQLVQKLRNTDTFNANIRANMIDNLSDNLGGNYASSFQIEQLLDLFDDYTTTDQGDVGSKVRSSMIRLVRNNKFHCVELDLKLIRLSGELMDTIRHSSFRLLAGKPFSWPNLFDYYNNSIADSQMKTEFWRGVVFTIGSTIGNSKTINEGFNEMLCHKITTSDIDILLSFVSLPKNRKMNRRELKCAQCTLQLILKLFEANYQFPQDLNFTHIFVACYNMHINTRNMNRIKTVLMIFYYIALKSETCKQRVYDRYLWILKNHTLNEVKVFVGEVILFNIVNDLNIVHEIEDDNLFASYEKIDWFDIDDQAMESAEAVLK